MPRKARDRERVSAIIFAAVFFFISSVGLPLVSGVTTTSDSQTALTGITNILCNKAGNSYDGQGQNGYGTRWNGTVTLQCDGAANTTVPLSVPLFGQAQFSISPQDGTNIAQRICNIILTGVNPFTGKEHQYSHVQDSCGTIDLSTYRSSICGPDTNDSGDSCGGNPFCQLLNGTWWRSGWVQLAIQLVLFFVFLAILLMLVLIPQKQRKERLRLKMQATGQDFKSWKQLQEQHNDSIRRGAGGGRISEQQQFLATPGGGLSTLSPFDDYQDRQGRGRFRDPQQQHRPSDISIDTEYDSAVVDGQRSLSPRSRATRGNFGSHMMPPPPPYYPEESGNGRFNPMEEQFGNDEEGGDYDYDDNSPLAPPPRPEGPVFYLHNMGSRKDIKAN